LTACPLAFERSWLYDELMRAQNFKQWFSKGRTVAALMTGVEQWFLPKLGMDVAPWTLHRKRPDHASPRPAVEWLAHRVPQTRWRNFVRSALERIRQQH